MSGLGSYFQEFFPKTAAVAAAADDNGDASTTGSSSSKPKKRIMDYHTRLDQIIIPSSSSPLQKHDGDDDNNKEEEEKEDHHFGLLEYTPEPWSFKVWRKFEKDSLCLYFQRRLGNGDDEDDNDDDDEDEGKDKDEDGDQRMKGAANDDDKDDDNERSSNSNTCDSNYYETESESSEGDGDDEDDDDDGDEDMEYCQWDTQQSIKPPPPSNNNNNNNNNNINNKRRKRRRKRIPPLKEAIHVVQNRLEFVDLYTSVLNLDLCQVIKIWPLRDTKRGLKQWPNHCSFTHPVLPGRMPRIPFDAMEEDGPLASTFKQVLSLEVESLVMASSATSSSAANDNHKNMDDTTTRTTTTITTQPYQHKKRRLRIFLYNSYAEQVWEWMLQAHLAKRDTTATTTSTTSNNTSIPLSYASFLLSLENIPAVCVLPFALDPRNWFDQQSLLEYCVCIGDVSSLKYSLPSRQQQQQQQDASSSSGMSNLRFDAPNLELRFTTRECWEEDEDFVVNRSTSAAFTKEQQQRRRLQNTMGRSPHDDDDNNDKTPKMKNIPQKNPKRLTNHWMQYCKEQQQYSTTEQKNVVHGGGVEDNNNESVVVVNPPSALATELYQKWQQRHGAADESATVAVAATVASPVVPIGHDDEDPVATTATATTTATTTAAPQKRSSPATPATTPKATTPKATTAATATTQETAAPKTTTTKATTTVAPTQVPTPKAATLPKKTLTPKAAIPPNTPTPKAPTPKATRTPEAAAQKTPTPRALTPKATAPKATAPKATPQAAAPKAAAPNSAAPNGATGPKATTSIAATPKRAPTPNASVSKASASSPPPLTAIAPKATTPAPMSTTANNNSSGGTSHTPGMAATTTTTTTTTPMPTTMTNSNPAALFCPPFQSSPPYFATQGYRGTPFNNNGNMGAMAMGNFPGFYNFSGIFPAPGNFPSPGSFLPGTFPPGTFPPSMSYTQWSPQNDASAPTTPAPAAAATSKVPPNTTTAAPQNDTAAQKAAAKTVTANAALPSSKIHVPGPNSTTSASKTAPPSKAHVPASPNTTTPTAAAAQNSNTAEQKAAAAAKNVPPESSKAKAASKTAPAAKSAPHMSKTNYAATITTPPSTTHIPSPNKTKAATSKEDAKYKEATASTDAEPTSLTANIAATVKPLFLLPLPKVFATQKPAREEAAGWLAERTSSIEKASGASASAADLVEPHNVNLTLPKKAAPGTPETSKTLYEKVAELHAAGFAVSVDSHQKPTIETASRKASQPPPTRTAATATASVIQHQKPPKDTGLSLAAAIDVDVSQATKSKTTKIKTTITSPDAPDKQMTQPLQPTKKSPPTTTEASKVATASSTSLPRTAGPDAKKTAIASSPVDDSSSTDTEIFITATATTAVALAPASGTKDVRPIIVETSNVATATKNGASSSGLCLLSLSVAALEKKVASKTNAAPNVLSTNTDHAITPLSTKVGKSKVTRPTHGSRPPDTQITATPAVLNAASQIATSKNGTTSAGTSITQKSPAAPSVASKGVNAPVKDTSVVKKSLPVSDATSKNLTTTNGALAVGAATDTASKATDANVRKKLPLVLDASSTTADARATNTPAAGASKSVSQQRPLARESPTKTAGAPKLAKARTSPPGSSVQQRQPASKTPSTTPKAATSRNGDANIIQQNHPGPNSTGKARNSAPVADASITQQHPLVSKATPTKVQTSKVAAAANGTAAGEVRIAQQRPPSTSTVEKTPKLLASRNGASGAVATIAKKDPPGKNNHQRTAGQATAATELSAQSHTGPTKATTKGNVHSRTEGDQGPAQKRARHSKFNANVPTTGSKKVSYTYTRLSTLKDLYKSHKSTDGAGPFNAFNHLSNIYGVVLGFSPPCQTKRGDWMMSASIVDDSCWEHPVTLVAFCKNPAVLPKLSRMGDVLRIHRVSVGEWAEEIQLLGKLPTSYAVVRPNDTNDIRNGWSVVASSKAMHFDESDKERSRFLWNWGQTLVTHTATIHANHRFTLSDMTTLAEEDDGRIQGRDLTVMVTGKIPYPPEARSGVTPCGLLRVWDGTGMPPSDPSPIPNLFTPHADGDPPPEAVARLAAIIRKCLDSQRSNNLEVPRALCGRVANALIWEQSHWDLLNPVAVGSFVRLRNVEVRPWKTNLFRTLMVHSKSWLTPLPDETFEVRHLLEEHNKRILREDFNPKSGLLPLELPQCDSNKENASHAKPRDLAHFVDSATANFKGLVKLLKTTPEFDGNYRSLCTPKPDGRGYDYRFAVTLADDTTSITAIVNNSVGEQIIGVKAVNVVDNTDKSETFIDPEVVWAVKIRSVLSKGLKYFVLLDATAV